MPYFKLADALAFQASWFAIAFLKDDALWIVAAIIVLRLWLSPTPRADLTLGLLLLPVGMMGEYLLLSLDALSYTSQWWLPFWMVGLWFVLLMTFNHSMSWLQKLPIWSHALLGAGSGLLSYLAGERFDALQVHSIPLIILIWGGLLPLLVAVTKIINSQQIRTGEINEN